MRTLALAACFTFAILPTGCTHAPESGDGGVVQQRHAPGERVLAFVGGRWFTGTTFEARTAYAVDGVLTFEPPARVDSTIQLAGGYVIPPFGEAHNHNVEHSSRIARTIGQYLRDGVFYVKNPNNLPRTLHPLAGMVNVPASIDVAFANGGLIGSGGHPAAHVQRNIARGVWTEGDGEGAFYFAVDDGAELRRVWQKLLEGRPDFLKTFLLYSEEYARRKDDPAFFGWKGLDPALLPEIVRRAHQAGLRVSTHVETAADFHHALVAGVDEISHMPGFRGDSAVQLPNPAIFEISEADARLAARLGTVVVTTVGGVREMDPAGPDSLLRRRFDRLHARNLRLLREHGVRLALGSDDYGDTSVGEAMYLHSLGVFDNLALLKLWAEATPQAIFPRRKLGCLQQGCEASFLVLRGDPISDFGHVRDIVLRVKQGYFLSAPAEVP
ncbi:amidohydrolase family protein [soil metagenome]